MSKEPQPSLLKQVKLDNTPSTMPLSNEELLDRAQRVRLARFNQTTKPSFPTITRERAYELLSGMAKGE